MEKIEKIKTLESIKETLKKEFIGLDHIIDDLVNAITPWYVTPEVLERPSVISLWGMTGTGKSSIVKRLVKLLDIEPKTLFFDCGTESNEGNTDVTGKICDFLMMDDIDTKINTEDMVFVFDEFQYARTINENGEEVNKCNLRPVWEMLDSGILSIKESDYDVTSLFNFTEDLQSFIETTPGSENISLHDGVVSGVEDIKVILSNLGFFYYDRGVPGMMSKYDTTYARPYSYRGDDEDKDEAEENPYEPLQVIENRYIRTIIRRLGMHQEERVVPGEIIGSINSCKTLGELCETLKRYKRILGSPRKLNCRKALVFVIGNLDEAFTCGNDTNPDIDADIFWSETEKVNISDIKEALQKRFRPEQIARFGNSIIKYPSLRKEHFEAIIRKEASRILSEFEKTTGVRVSVDLSLYDLLYSEGVYPVQGVRPVFSTISTILTPLLSDILCESWKSARISVIDPGKGYKLDKKSMCLSNTENGKDTVVKEIPLTLGALRNPEKRGTRYNCGIHEAGHAIVMAWCTGVLPDAIISVSTDGGGFCVTYDKTRDKEIRFKQDVANSAKIGLAGWEAEALVFGSDNVLLGSGNDIQETWEELSTAVYELGYIDPRLYANRLTSAGDQVPGGLKDDKIDKSLETLYSMLEEETKKILREEKTLLCKLGLRLGECGCMKGPEFLEYIKKYGKTLSEETMKEAKKRNDYDHYKDVILGCLGDM